MKRRLIILSALGLPGWTGCSRSPAPDSREADARALRDGEVAAFVKDWGGKDAIGKAMKDVLTDPNWSLALQVVQVEVSRGGDLGYTRGTYVLTATDPASKKAVTEKGRFVTIFRKEADGSWKAVQEISNAEAPAAPSSN